MSIRKLVVVGGGTAGWLTACLVAAEQADIGEKSVQVVLIESPDIPIIGVGEGTWPSMRTSLQRIGLPEDELIAECDATFKQGTCFIGWSGRPEFPKYYHPFSPPVEYATLNPVDYWLRGGGERAFADFVTPQAKVIELGLAPKQPGTPPYAFAVNYAYHFDAGNFAALLARHGVERLGVRRVRANLREITSAPNGDIAALHLDNGDEVAGDLFVDCTGRRALLLAGHCGVGFKSVKSLLFNDAAVVAQLPWPRENQALPSTTQSLAREAGWIWDIGLQGRRGVGYVHAREHASASQAEQTLREYVSASGGDPEAASFRSIEFEPGYRERFWVGNCVSVGLSAGFVEPLEASAIALIEQAAGMLARELPANRALMEITAKRFNRSMSRHWSRIIEFLKLHYVLSARADTDYWRRCREPDTCPDELRESLLLWRQRPPWYYDAPLIDELFPAASYQYVLYGMGFRTDERKWRRPQRPPRQADRILHEQVVLAGERMSGLLPANRALVGEIVGRYRERQGR